MATEAVKVVGGPSQWDLIIKGLAHQEPVTFKLENGSDVAVAIRSIANEQNYDTVTPDDEEYTRIGGWLIEGERVPSESELDTDMFYIVYLSYSTETRQGFYNIYEFDLGSNPDAAYHELLRYEWGDRVWGGDGWRP